jgi:hypothetical protein
MSEVAKTELVETSAATSPALELHWKEAKHETE